MVMDLPQIAQIKNFKEMNFVSFYSNHLPMLESVTRVQRTWWVLEQRRKKSGRMREESDEGGDGVGGITRDEGGCFVRKWE